LAQLIFTSLERERRRGEKGGTLSFLLPTYIESHEESGLSGREEVVEPPV